MGGTTSDPAKRRAVNACLRCRRQKIKCTGGCPCDNCKRRKATCIAEGEDAKVLVTKKHLSEVKRRTIELEKEINVLREHLSGYKDTAPSADHIDQPRSPLIEMDTCNILLSPDWRSELPEPGFDDDARMVNPLSTGPPKYITDIVGRSSQHMDSTTYDLGWDGLRTTVIPDITGLPSLDHSLFLINATKFHTGRIFHLFDEPTFVPQVYEFYKNPAEKIHRPGLWFIHFLVIIALGKGFVGTNTRGKVPPGADLFKKSFLMLPDYCYLWRHPSTSAELLCSMALYFQCIDWRTSAHNMIGQALRILLVHGYHTNFPSETLGDQTIQRSRNIWWTTFILECQMSVLMGVPLGISNDEISTPLPSFPNPPHIDATVAIHVKLSQALGQVLDTIYGQGGQIKANLLISTQRVLKSVAGVASELTSHFPVPEDGSVNGISRVSGYLNLLFHECIMLATRPFLFGLFEKRLQCTDNETLIPTPIMLLLQACLESSKRTVDILRALQDQSLLESFLPFDLESAVSAGLVILMTTFVSCSLIENHGNLRYTVFGIFDEIINKGNLVAKDHKAELQILETLLGQYQAPMGAPPNPEGPEQQVSVSDQDIDMRESMGTGETVKAMGLGLDAWGGEVDIIGNDSEHVEASNWTHVMSPTQLMTLVDMLNADSVRDWATCLGDFPGLVGEDAGID